MTVSSAQERVPEEVWLAVLNRTAESNLAVKRRMFLLSILWNESHLTREALTARVEALAGMGCFGRQSTLTFARDIRFVREALRTVGHRLRYSRRSQNQGYYITGRPPLHPKLEKLIQAAVAEISSEQAAIYAQLTPAQRVQQGASLSDRLRRQAAQRLIREHPELDEAAANREALRRMYQLKR